MHWTRAVHQTWASGMVLCSLARLNFSVLVQFTLAQQLTCHHVKLYNWRYKDTMYYTRRNDGSVRVDQQYDRPTSDCALLHSRQDSQWHYFQSFLRDMFLSLSFFMTLATAISKSSWVTWILRSRRANMPASVQLAFSSAPEAPCTGGSRQWHK